MLNKTGVPTLEQLLSKFPSLDKLNKPKAVIECYEDIPCNPCETSCPFDAIHIGDNINAQPVLDVDKCTGCTICVTACPGLAITVAEMFDDKVTFKIPYELTPLPNRGDVVKGVNRNGDVICDAVIERAVISRVANNTGLLTVSVPKEFVYDFITVKV